MRVLDGDDAYLVVAADKGTAHLSDTANAISEEYGFWLGDAFASGGSDGYDHKALGITAKGAWESVKRHFRELGRDVADRAGDRRRHRRHVGRRLRERHAALGAAPSSSRRSTTATSSSTRRPTRRRRTPSGGGSSTLQGTSWDDYDRSLISEGGGVWPRTAKSIPVSPQAQAVLGDRQPEARRRPT